MRTFSNKNYRGRLLCVAGLLACGMALTTRGEAVAGNSSQPAASIVRVEEDWTLMITEPNADTASPQVSSQMSANPNASQYCNLHLNAQDVPTYGAGGLQLQAWQDATSIGTAKSESSAVMSTSSETVTWTQFLDASKSKLIFGISAASSQTWGDFSGKSITVTGATADLTNYSADYSANNSGVTYGANRVAYLGITQIRTYYSDGTMQTDSTERVIYPAAGTGTTTQQVAP